MSNSHNDPRTSIPNNFGDVMSSRTTTLLLPNEFSGLERICLTANGNLQRILSSWFNKTVTIDIVKNDSVDIKMEAQKTTFTIGNLNYNDGHVNNCNELPILKRFDREVNLVCEDKIICNAKSDVIIRDSSIVQLIEHEGVGIGQLFRYLDKLPSFHLNYVGRTEKTWWREYSLYIPGVECHIKETFPSNMFENSEGTIDGDDNDGSTKTWKVV
ncbi:10471_t:CDS:2 [Funneliformis mosseae]|uniref:10471_t:CDS:1 n=1 Tax=Funneliformis mosseae TaxID=27381 RepID=A0A9N9GC81_FUNMO|nr:10471_t:CDS:2 [Funneliformis mosseae]